MNGAAALEGTQWHDWTKTPIAGDASSRQYFRLSSGTDDTLILMLDPARSEGATVAFERIAKHLLAIGLAAPAIHFHDPATGTMLLEDLGTVDVAALLSDHPQNELRIYGTILDVLSHLHRAAAPDGIPVLDHTTAARALDLTTIHYARSPHLTEDLQHCVFECFNKHVSTDYAFSLRDFHAQNLIWRPEHSGLSRIGVLDFQDACLAPVGYDLVSLLRDVRRNVDPDLARQMIKRFQVLHGGPTDAHLACVGVQRNLRILGVFARLAANGKPQYLKLLPRVWRQLMIDLVHPDLHDLHSFIVRNLPEPD